MPGSDLRLVEVVWNDASSAHGWHNEEDIPPVSDVRSVGLVHRDDDNALALLQSVNRTEDGPGTRTANCGNSLVIPRSAVREVHELIRKEK